VKKSNSACIKLLVLDFDGVLTNNTVIVDENGKESVICNRSDGLAIEMFKKKGVEVIVLSREKNKVVKFRCEKLKISCIQGITNKLDVLKKETNKRGLSSTEIGFVGNDINDLECIKYSGLGIVVKDAFPEVKEIADFITQKKGGEGVLHEIYNLLN